MGVAALLSAPGAHARAAFVLLRRPGATLTALEQTWRMVAMGGLLVRTPDCDEALIATTLQLDGDLMVMIRRDVLDASEAQRADLIDRHIQDLRNAAASLAPAAGGIDAIRSAALAVWAGLQGAALGRLGFVWAEVWRHLASLLALQLPALLAFVLHLSLPRLVHLALRVQLAPVLREWRDASKTAGDGIDARRKQRAGN
jgi:hypothetical protein